MFLIDKPTAADPERFIVVERATKAEPFDANRMVPIAEFNTRCPTDLLKSIDITDDGLRAYLSCGMQSDSSQTVYYAHRSTRTDAFQVDPDPIADGVGLSFAVSANELIGYSSGIPSTGPPLMFTRQTTTEKFGTASPVPGLETGEFRAPDVSNDDLLLFGGIAGTLAFALRMTPSEGWGPPSLVSLGSADTVGAPTIAASCRAVYFVQFAADSTSSIQFVVR